MARGWESKSIEAQQDEAQRKDAPPKPHLTPEAAATVRQRESLRLSLQRVLSEIEHSRSAQHRAMLEAAKADLESKLRGLDT